MQSLRGWNDTRRETHRVGRVSSVSAKDAEFCAGCGDLSPKRRKNGWRTIFWIAAAVLLLAMMSSPAFAARYYVKTDGNDAAEGTSWTVALLTLTKAADRSASGDEVCVAQGTYKEAKEVTIISNVSFYGGFAGNETDLYQRNISAHPTVIDGEDSRRCVINSGVLDGFHVTGGKSDIGGGIYNDGTVTNCTVYQNIAIGSFSYGGGIYNDGTVTNCALYQNTAFSVGGGIYNYGGVTNCTVYQNSAVNGGGIYNYDTVESCTVYQNNAYYGGGIYNYGGVTNCTVYQNSATGTYSYGGGGIYNDHGIVINCTVYQNSAKSNGGGIYNHFYNTVTNCISWGNQADDIYGSSELVRFSCFREGTSGEGNIASDPMFINTLGDISTWDFRLKPGSPCIDAGTSQYVPETDILGAPRPQGAGFDMGAYEWVHPFGPQRLLDVLLGREVLEPWGKSPGDANGDGKVDVADYISLMEPAEATH